MIPKRLMPLLHPFIIVISLLNLTLLPFHPSHASNASLPLQGSCVSSQLLPGDQLSRGSHYLCHPGPTTSNDTLSSFQFGINPSGQIAYYILFPNHTSQLLWSSSSPSSIQYMRMQSSLGSLAGYNSSQFKVYDSHIDSGLYSPFVTAECGGIDLEENVLGDPMGDSVLTLTHMGVFIMDPEGRRTFQILIPEVLVEGGDGHVDETVGVEEDASDDIGESDLVNSSSDPITVSGRVFYDDTSGDMGLFDDVVGNVIIDLYDCTTSTNNSNKWIAVTRTDAEGNYQFVDKTISSSSSSSSLGSSSGSSTTSSTTTTDLTSMLDEKGITQFRAVFSGLPDGVAFSTTSDESDVVSGDGETSCWDVERDGPSSIVWNAGIKPVGGTPPTGVPTTIMVTMTPTFHEEVPSVAPTTVKPAVALVTIGGYAFLDVDDDGVRGPNETTAVANVDVRLFTSCDSSLSSSSSSSGSNNDDGTFFSAAITDTQGVYKFVNIPSGSYKIKATTPEGYVFSSIWTGNNATANSTINPETGDTKCFVSTDGKRDLSWGMGMRKIDDASNTSSITSPVVISGMVFDDVKNDGVFDTEEGDMPMADVSVALFDCDGNMKMMDKTDVNGMYGFDDLTPDSYLLKFSAPQGYHLSAMWSGLVDEEGYLVAPDADSNINPETASSVCRLYKAGEADYSLDAGMSSSSTTSTTTTTNANSTTSIAKPTSKPSSTDAQGDGTLCSGAECPMEGMCRSKAGLCGTGLSFCNYESVWTQDCVEGGSGTNSSDSTFSSQSTSQPGAALTSIASDDTTSLCHVDGSVGDVNGTNSIVSNVEFSYSIESEVISSSLIELFEKELNRHVACEYVDIQCLLCNNTSKKRAGSSAGKNTTLIGLSPEPKDEITLQPCPTPSPNCKVMKGIMTSYYPQGTSASVLDSEQKQLLDAIDNVITTNFFVGMTVSLQNSLPALNEGAKSAANSSVGLSGGGIAGIVIALVFAFALIITLGVLRIRRIRDEEDEEYFQQMQEKSGVPFGHDDLNGDNDDEDDDSDDSSDDSTNDSAYPSRTAISGETSLTNMAQAAPEDIDSDSSSESESSESDEEAVDEANKEIYSGKINQQGIDQMKYSAGSDEAPPIYENFDRMDSEEMAAAAATGYYDHPRDQRYPYLNRPHQRAVGGDVAADDATATESVKSADPPGQSYRDLPDDWISAPYSSGYGSGSESDGSDQGSYLSSNSSHSNRSDHRSSQRLNRSHRSNGGSHYSRHSNPDPEEADNNDSYRHSNSYHSGHSGSDRSFSEDEPQPHRYHDQHAQYMREQNYQAFAVAAAAAAASGHNMQKEGRLNDNATSDDSARYDQAPPPRGAAYLGGGATQSHQFQAEILDDKIDDTSVYTSATRKASNVSPEISSLPRGSEHDGQPHGEKNGDEESISEIFKSLSAIQNRLANKGKSGRKDHRSRKDNKEMPSRAAAPQSRQQGWDQEGLVEDVSVDGSHISSMVANQHGNRRPQQGQWMEPVDEGEP